MRFYLSLVLSIVLIASSASLLGCSVRIGDMVVGCEPLGGSRPEPEQELAPLEDEQVSVQEPATVMSELSPEEVLERYYGAYLDLNFEAMLPYATAEHQVEILFAKEVIESHPDQSEITNYPVDYSVESITYLSDDEVAFDTVNYMLDGSSQEYRINLIRVDDTWMVSSSF